MPRRFFDFHCFSCVSDNNQVEDENLFSTDGLKPSIHDLDNIFEDSDTELNLDGTLAVPTPPSSVKVRVPVQQMRTRITINLQFLVTQSF